MLKKLKHPIRTLIGIASTLLSIVASIFLIYQAATQGNAWHIISFSIYGFSLISMWTISTLYHSLNVSTDVNRTLEQLDHAMIYLLIAGTYTPLCLVVLRGGWGWSLFGVNWALAIAGIVLKLVLRKHTFGVGILFFTFYLLMGWLIAIAWIPLTHSFTNGGMFWLVMGGILYSVGAIFFNVKHLKVAPHFGAHEIWHLFVAAAGFCHYWMMLKYVLYISI